MKFAWMTSGSSFLSIFNFDFSFSIRSFFSYILAQSTEILEHILYVLLVYLVVCLGIYKWIFSDVRTRRSEPQSRGFSIFRLLNLVKPNSLRFIPENEVKHVLFVISHPDDECMFFGPTILSLSRRSEYRIYVLCLSHGNYDKQGSKRRKELWDACNMLGVSSSNIILINSTHLPDDPNLEWKTQSVANLILNTIESLDIKYVVTFDRDGVSQHPNHCAVYYATASLCLANLLPKGCKFFTLDSVNPVRKYISLFDLLCTCLMSTHWCILSWKDASRIRSAMKMHKSQMKWFRWLYIYFSRYMFINSLREINLSDVELEMQIHDS